MLKGAVDIQVKLDELHKTADDPLWLNARNAWIRALAPTTVGRIGEELALKVLGGEAKQGRRPQLWDGNAAVRIVEVLAAHLAAA